MTIILTPATEARLRAVAQRDGRDVNAVAEALLTEALADDVDDLTTEQVVEIRAGIQRGLEAAAAGRERSLAEYAAEVRQRRAARIQAPDA